MPKSILKKTKKKTPGRRSKRKVRTRLPRKPKRPHGDGNTKLRHARRRHAKRHPKSRVRPPHKRMRREAETMNYLLHQMLRTMSDKETDPDMPFHYDPRHHTKDVEYQHSSFPLQEFKRSVPAPDVHFWRPQGRGLPTHRGNVEPGRWRPQWNYPVMADDIGWAGSPGHESDADMY